MFRWSTSLFGMLDAPPRGFAMKGCTHICLAVMALALPQSPCYAQIDVAPPRTEISARSASQISTRWRDPSPHRVQRVTVDKDVQLEVLDWGGTGRPLVFLSGMGSTAHVWDDFAPKFTSRHHVYAITRRGYGISSAPETGYTADRLADDVLAGMTAMKVTHPVLIGHSIAGEEMSSIASRYPERVAGLVYLDAGYAYAFYDTARGDYDVDLASVHRDIAALAVDRNNPKRMQQLQADLPSFERTLQAERVSHKEKPPVKSPPAQNAADTASFAAYRAHMATEFGAPPPESELRQVFAVRPDGGVGAPLAKPFVTTAMYAGMQKYTSIPVPVLAIFGYPHGNGAATPDRSPKALEAAKQADADVDTQIDAFTRGVPTARVVRLAFAHHFVFVSNEADVLREIQQFVTLLPSAD